MANILKEFVDWDDSLPPYARHSQTPLPDYQIERAREMLETNSSLALYAELKKRK